MTERPINVLFLTRYDRDAASSRQRFFQYILYLKSMGIACRTKPLFWNGYLKHRFKKKNINFLKKLVSSYVKRAKTLLGAKGYDLLFVQMELLPYLPAIAERLLLPPDIPRIYDFDDAWFYRYLEHQNYFVRNFLGKKISNLASKASGVVVGSDFLYKYISQHQNNVILIPTCIDLNLYPVSPPVFNLDKPFTIGWIGSPATSPFLNDVMDVLKKFCSAYNARVVLIGAEPQSVNMPNLEYIQWAEESEVEELSKFDVGIMPLRDTPFTRGKCAFKLIQYMGCWKPVIASPVGENVIVVEHGINGFLADNPDQWYSALKQLYDNRELRVSMGIQGRAKVEQEYNLAVAAPRLAKVLRDTVTVYKNSRGFQ